MSIDLWDSKIEAMQVNKLKELGAMPFVMPYNKSDQYQKSFARWVNNRAVFNSCSWNEYKYNNP